MKGLYWKIKADEPKKMLAFLETLNEYNIKGILLMNTSKELKVGTAVGDITPPIGIAMAGDLDPRERLAEGTLLPLQVKVMVIEIAGQHLVYALFDLIHLEHLTVAKALEQITAEIGISADRIVWTCSHTHSGPVTRRWLKHIQPGS